MTEKHCLYCETLYVPYSRMATRQKTCGAPECVAKHKWAMEKHWLAERPERKEARNKKKREWAEKCDYSREYRLKHPEYTALNRAQSQERMKQRRELEAVLRQPVEYLECLRGVGGVMFANQELLAKSSDGEHSVPPYMFANQELLNRRLDGTLRYLKAQAMFANFKSIDADGGIGVKLAHGSDRDKPRRAGAQV